MRRLMAALLMLMMTASQACAQAAPQADAAPRELGITLAEFVQKYNSQEGVNPPIEAMGDIGEGMHGIVYLPANEQVDVFVQLAYDQQNDNVLFAGCVLDKDTEPDFEGFLAVCGHVMGVVFPDLQKAAREALLMDAILDGYQKDAYLPTSRTRSHISTDGTHTVKYMVDDGNKRQMVAYVEE